MISEILLHKVTLLTKQSFHSETFNLNNNNMQPRKIMHKMAIFCCFHFRKTLKSPTSTTLGTTANDWIQTMDIWCHKQPLPLI